MSLSHHITLGVTKIEEKNQFQWIFSQSFPKVPNFSQSKLLILLKMILK